MKKNICLIFCIIIVIITIFHWNDFLKKSTLLENNVIKSELLSPNGKYKAIKFNRNINATTQTSYHLSILAYDDNLSDEIGNIYISYDDFEFKWRGDILEITHNKKDRVFKSNSIHENIKIQYITHENVDKGDGWQSGDNDNGDVH